MRIIANYFETLEALIKENNHNEYLLFVASKTNVDLSLLKNSDIKIYGGIFPQIIFKDKVYDYGMIAIEINNNMKIDFIKDISKTSLDKNNFKDIKSVITILEGLSTYTEPFIQELFDNVDIHTNILGAGAGSFEEKTNAFIFDNSGLYKDAAILLSLKNSIDLGVKHGWEYLDGPYVVTSAEGNIVKTIDHRSAFEVYKEIVEKDYGISLTKENFLEVSKNYPFGIVKYKGEEVVRDPIAFDGDNLILVGKISNNSVLNVLKGRNESLLEASREAISDALKNSCDFILVFDCITRKSFLEDKFDDELGTIFEETNASTFIGAISIGEIANEGNKYINFLNKTCVIGGICF
ncbi:MAG: FIST signal transduction protein [Arcobacter sp.]|uniref:FIST signal transduction protein n=1 Tax=Arcobacter sp. TaxID=1872629 RepID=UPI003B009EC9